MKAEDALAEIVRAVARGPGHVVDALRIAVKATRSRAGVVWRREGENLRPADAHGLADDALARMGAQRIQEGAPGAEKEAARARRTIHVPALALHPLAGGTTDALARGGLTSLLAVPLVEAGEAVGVLALYGAGPFDAQESAEAERLAPALALAVRLETLRADVAGRVRG
ncbi:MAG TPA: GAF domain-containing protein, partial [Candidatus Thermoplasmatota archaeon]|nr:GAF domain-containing protein [Candidatus Thermoplasmatota archaeon]